MNFKFIICLFLVIFTVSSAKIVLRGVNFDEAKRGEYTYSSKCSEKKYLVET